MNGMRAVGNIHQLKALVVASLSPSTKKIEIFGFPKIDRKVHFNKYQ